MDDLATLIRLATLALDEKRKIRAALDAQVAQTEAEKKALLDQLEDERLHPPDALEGGLTQGAFIKASYDRCEQLDARLSELARLIAAVQEDIRAAFEEVKRYEIAQEQRDRAQARAERHRETKALDEVGGEISRRRATDSA